MANGYLAPDQECRDIAEICSGASSATTGGVNSEYYPGSKFTYNLGFELDNPYCPTEAWIVPVGNDDGKMASLSAWQQEIEKSVLEQAPNGTGLTYENCSYRQNGKQLKFEVYDSTSQFRSNRIRAKIRVRLEYL